MTRVPPVPIGKDFNPGGARWCDQPNHKRLECTGHRQTGEQCHAPAVRGEPNCKRHTGTSKEVAMVRGEARITAWQAVGQAVPGQRIDAGMAVMGVLQMTWLRLHAYSDLLRRQVVTDGDAAGEVTRYGEDPEESGLIGFKYGAAGKDGRIYVQNEEVRALVLLEAAERDRVVKYAEVAHKMGISDRVLDLAERWSDITATRITTLLDALDLSPEQLERVPMLVESHLGTIDVDILNGTGR